jgi:predicted metal-dependent hydrolase
VNASNKEVRVVRSERRHRTVMVRDRGSHFEVLAPANWPESQLQPIIDRLVQRLERRQEHGALSQSDLQVRAEALNAQYFGATLRWASIAWVSNQDRRWGSCTPLQGTIRVSHRLATFPEWVLDYVIVHELAHLVVAGHNQRFWALVNRYPLSERARGYLIAKSSDATDEDM